MVEGVAELLLGEQFGSQKAQATVLRTVIEVSICSDFLFSFFPVLYCVFLIYFYTYRELLFSAVQLPSLPKTHSLQKSLNHCLLCSSAQLPFALESRFESPCHISGMSLSFLTTVKSVSPSIFFKNKTG